MCLVQMVGEIRKLKDINYNQKLIEKILSDQLQTYMRLKVKDQTKADFKDRKTHSS